MTPQFERLDKQVVDPISVKSIIRSFSVPTEFCLVIFICFGLPIVGNTVWLVQQLWLTGGTEIETRHIQNEDLVFLAVLEVVTLSVVLAIGKTRGWSLTTFGLRPTWKWSAAGVLLFGAFGLIGWLIRWLAASIAQSSVDFHRVSHATLPVVILICIVNPVFEEALECGYFFQALQRHGMWVTVLASAAFRGFLHTTMGIHGFVFMFAEGLVHGFFYWRWRQLWPLIIAHSLQMLYALLPPSLSA